MCLLLDSIEIATTELSWEKYCTIFLVLPIVTQLTVDFKSVHFLVNDLTKIVKSFGDSFINWIKDRFSYFEDHELYFTWLLLYQSN